MKARILLNRKFHYQITGIAVVLAFMAVSLFGLVMMIDDHGGMMPNCPFMPGMNSLCQMTIADHINAWSQIFFGLPQWQLFGSLLILAVILSSSFSLLASAVRPPGKWRYYFHWQFVLQPSWSLAQSLADGTVQPRLYN